MESFLQKMVRLSCHFATAEGKNEVEPLHLFLAVLTAIFHRSKLICSRNANIDFTVDDIVNLKSLAFMLDIEIGNDEESQLTVLQAIDEYLPNYDDFEMFFTELEIKIPGGQILFTALQDETLSVPLSKASITIFSLVDIGKYSSWNYAYTEAMVSQSFLTAILGSRDQRVDNFTSMTDAQFVKIAATFLNNDCFDSDDILENGTAILQALVNHGHTDKLDGICRAFAPVSEHSQFANALVSCLKFGCCRGLPKPPLEHSLNRMYWLFLGLQAENHYEGINDALRENVLQGSMNEAVTLVLKSVPLSDRNG